MFTSRYVSVRYVCNHIHLCLRDSSSGYCLTQEASPIGISLPACALITASRNTGGKLYH